MSRNLMPAKGWLPQQLAHEGRRQVDHSEDDWWFIKEAIDTLRQGIEDDGSIKILMTHNLWDYNRSCPDEEAINLLYMRNA